jgi:hypothetical protein
MLCPQGVPYTRYPIYQPTTRILRLKKLRLRAGRSEPCCRGVLDTASWHKTNQQTHYLGLVGDLLNDLTGVNLAGFSFHKRFLSERFRPIAFDLAESAGCRLDCTWVFGTALRDGFSKCGRAGLKQTHRWLFVWIGAGSTRSTYEGREGRHGSCRIERSSMPSSIRSSRPTWRGKECVDCSQRTTSAFEPNTLLQVTRADHDK